MKYCDAFNEWLDGDRRHQSPCEVCAKVFALRTRANEQRRRAEDLDKAADMRMEQHK